MAEENVKEKEVDTPIAVSVEEMKKFGCPYCGYRSGTTSISGGGTAVWRCGECGRGCAVLAKGVAKSTVGFGDFYPELQDHPRRGIPSHGRPDEKPEGGGEFFCSRGIGLDNTPGCFVCGGGTGLYNNIAAFVQCKAAGERVVAMFKKGARLDYRDYEPDRVQVKVGACDNHKENLGVLSQLTSEGEKSIITQEMIQKAISS